MTLGMDSNRSLNYRIDEYEAPVENHLNELEKELSGKAEARTHILYYHGPFSSGKTYLSKIIERKYDGIYLNVRLLSESTKFYITAYIAYTLTNAGINLPFSKFAIAEYLKRFREIKGFNLFDLDTRCKEAIDLPSLNEIPSSYQSTASELIKDKLSDKNTLDRYLSLDLSLYAEQHDKPLIIILDDLFSLEKDELEWLLNGESSLIGNTKGVLWVMTCREEIENNPVYCLLRKYSPTTCQMSYMEKNEVREYFKSHNFNQDFEDFYKETDNGIPLLVELKIRSLKDEETFKDSSNNPSVQMSSNYAELFYNWLTRRTWLLDDVRKLSYFYLGWTLEISRGLSISDQVYNLPFIYSSGSRWFMNEEIRLSFQEKAMDAPESKPFTEFSDSIGNSTYGWESTIPYLLKELKYSGISFIRLYNEELYRYVEDALKADNIFASSLAISPIAAMFKRHGLFFSENGCEAWFNGGKDISSYFINSITSDYSIGDSVYYYLEYYKGYLEKKEIFDEEDYRDRSGNLIEYTDDEIHTKERAEAEAKDDLAAAERYYQEALERTKEEFPGINYVSIAVRLAYHKPFEVFSLNDLYESYYFLYRNFGLDNILTEKVLLLYIIELFKTSKDIYELGRLSKILKDHSMERYGLKNEYTLTALLMISYTTYKSEDYKTALDNLILFIILIRSTRDRSIHLDHKVYLDNSEVCSEVYYESPHCYFPLDIADFAINLLTGYIKTDKDPDMLRKGASIANFLREKSVITGIPYALAYKELIGKMSKEMQLPYRLDLLYYIFSFYQSFSGNAEIKNYIIENLNLMVQEKYHFTGNGEQEDPSVEWYMIRDRYLDHINEDIYRNLHSESKLNIAAYYEKKGDSSTAVSFHLQNIFINRYDIRKQLISIGKLSLLFRQQHKHKEQLLMLQFLIENDYTLSNCRKAELLFAITKLLYQLKQYYYAYDTCRNLNKLITEKKLSLHISKLDTAAQNLRSLLRKYEASSNKPYKKYLSELNIELQQTYPELKFIYDRWSDSKQEESDSSYSFPRTLVIQEIINSIKKESDFNSFEIEYYPESLNFPYRKEIESLYSQEETDEEDTLIQEETGNSEEKPFFFSEEGIEEERSKDDEPPAEPVKYVNTSLYLHTTGSYDDDLDRDFYHFENPYSDISTQDDFDSQHSEDYDLYSEDSDPDKDKSVPCHSIFDEDVVF